MSNAGEIGGRVVEKEEIDSFLNDYDWGEVFAFAGGGGSNPPEICVVMGDKCPATLFSRKDVKVIYGSRAGENDEYEWLIWGKLNDNRYFYIEAGCDYTGFDCQASGRAWVASSKKKIIDFGMGDMAREVFGLKVSQVAKEKPCQLIAETQKIPNMKQRSELWQQFVDGRENGEPESVFDDRLLDAYNQKILSKKDFLELMTEIALIRKNNPV